MLGLIFADSALEVIEMLLKEMINKYPKQYIAVAYVKKGVDNYNLIALLELSEKGGEMASPMGVDVLDVGYKPLYIDVNPNECWVPTQLDISNVLDALSGDKNET